MESVFLFGSLFNISIFGAEFYLEFVGFLGVEFLESTILVMELLISGGV